jgi:hypothetical protein
MTIKDFEVKTQMSEPHYRAMLKVIEAKGLTQAGYVRHLVLKDIYESDDLVSQMAEITSRTIMDLKRA